MWTSCLPRSSDRLMTDAQLPGDCPVRLLRARLDQLGDKLALLLGGKVAAMDVGADDVGNSSSVVLNPKILIAIDGARFHPCVRQASYRCRPSRILPL